MEKKHMWMGYGVFSPAYDLSEKLEAGHYSVWRSMSNVNFTRIKIASDEILVLPDSPTHFVIEQINKFWQGTEMYEKFNFLQKRGILFYGPPGCGKTSVLNCITRSHIMNDGVVFAAQDNEPGHLAPCLKAFRNIEPNRPVIILLEDFETMLESSNGSNYARNEQLLLSLLDGTDQIDNILVLATTNKPDVVADRFIKRPGRFDLVIGMTEPTANDRKTYIHQIVNGRITEDQLNEIVQKTEGLSLAHMREIVSCYLVLDIPIEESIARLKINKSTNFARAAQNGKSYVVGF